MDPEYEEMDIFEIDLDHVPLPVQHICLLSGVEYEVWSFEASLVESVKENPMQPFPEMYNRIR